ncbi:L-lactate permease [Bordetella muralis]|uniref:L-lactate permease n=1 Tax=Bordetella muralis TaxID=1649130 RepID=UPI0039F03D20
MTLKFWLYFSPFWVPIALMLTRRVPISMAALVAAIVSAALYWFSGRATDAATFSSAGIELLKGIWLATPIVSVILAGLLFHSLLTTCWSPQVHGQQAAAPAADLRLTLFGTCFLIGPFTETATGFGVGLVVSLGILLRAGLPKHDAIVFSLFSQILVAWGAFAVGTMLGFSLAGISDPRELGWRSAVLVTPVLIAWLGAYWSMCRGLGLSNRPRDLIREALWIAAILVGLVTLSRYADPDMVGLIVLGGAAALYGFVNGGQSLRAKLTEAAPYVVLCACLVACRFLPVLHESLLRVQIKPFADGMAWPVLLSPVFWLMLVGLGFALAKAPVRDVGRVLAMTWQRGKITVGVTLLFVICARFMMAGGIPGILAHELQATIGTAAAVILSPVLAAIAGFLTASNAASNSLLMPNVVGLAHAGNWSVEWIAAIQNVTGSALSMLSPVRIMMGCAIAALGAGATGAIYRRAWPLGFIPVVLMVGAACIVVAVTH